MTNCRETQAFEDFRNSFEGDPSPKQLQKLCQLIRAENSIKDAALLERGTPSAKRVFRLLLNNSGETD
jgi:hypothetical protein